MNDILDLPPAIHDNPNRKTTLLILFAIALVGMMFRMFHLPFGSLLRILGFGLLSGYTIHGLRANRHPKLWFRISLYVCCLWLILCVFAWQTDPENSINEKGILLYLGITAIAYVSFQSRHYIRKIRRNSRPDNSR